MDEGYVCLPERRLASLSHPWLLRISAVLLCTWGDLPLWTSSTLLMSFTLLQSCLEIRLACRSSARTVGEERKWQGGQSHITTQDREYSYLTQVYTAPQEWSMLIDGSWEASKKWQMRRDTLHHTHTDKEETDMTLLLGQWTCNGYSIEWEGLAGQVPQWLCIIT